MTQSMMPEDARAISLPTVKLSPQLMQVVEELGFTDFTEIQRQSIPVLLEGRDVIGQSQTGSGKTAAFALPLLEKVQLKSDRIQALILCPTRELCTQVSREVRRLGRRHPGLQVLAIAGGQPIRPQILELERGAHIVVGTPGRILDHIKRGTIALSGAGTVVLDEADRMLDMGFEEDMKRILGALPRERQTVFFSATYPATIAAMSQQYQSNPVHIKVGQEEADGPAIEQRAYTCKTENKVATLLWLLGDCRPNTAVVFCNLKSTVNEVASQLAAHGVSAAPLHGDLQQFDRDRVMGRFRNQSARVLVATDVAARGIDVANLDLVVNFDLPGTPEVYVHRIGRTGRAGKAGLAISLITPRESYKIEAVEKFTRQKIAKSSIPSADALHIANQGSMNLGARMVTFAISAGRKQKLRPGDILGALTGEAGGFPATSIGKIEIHDFFSYVAIASDIAPVALEKLKGGKIKGRRIPVELVR